MYNMVFIALMVVSCVLINPFISASEKTKKVAAVEQTQSDDQNEGDSDEDNETEEEQSCN
jgi:hypothetical protein